MTAVVNPATEENDAEVPAASAEDADRAVEAARRAFPGWRAVAPADRARLLRRLAGLVEEHGEELARLETGNVGKPIADSRGEVAMVVSTARLWSSPAPVAGWAATPPFCSPRRAPRSAWPTWTARPPRRRRPEPRTRSL